jgi:hypothetical protein
VVVHYLDLLCSAVVPDEADPILVIDPDAVLALPVAGEGLEVVARERAKIVESLSGVELHQLALRDPSHGLEPAGRDPLKQGLGVSVPEGPDHGSSL